MLLLNYEKHVLLHLKLVFFWCYLCLFVLETLSTMFPLQVHSIFHIKSTIFSFVLLQISPTVKQIEGATASVLQRMCLLPSALWGKNNKESAMSMEWKRSLLPPRTSPSHLIARHSFIYIYQEIQDVISMVWKTSPFGLCSNSL